MGNKPRDRWRESGDSDSATVRRRTDSGIQSLVLALVNSLRLRRSECVLLWLALAWPWNTQTLE